MKKTLLFAAMLLASTISFAQSRSALIHLKSGEVKEIEYSQLDSITFTDPVTYDFEQEASYATSIFYGSRQYNLRLSDKPLANGLPTEVGQMVLRVYPIAPDPANSSINCNLAAGRYEANKSFENYSLYLGDSWFCVLYCTGFVDGQPQGYSFPLSHGALNVSYNADGSASLDFKGGFAEPNETLGNVQNIHITYNGTVEYDNQDPKAYKSLTEDMNVVPTGMGGRYETDYYGTYGMYTMALFNTPIDNDGFVVGAGEVVNLSLITKYTEHMDINNLAGEYTVADVINGPYEPGKFLSGTLYENYGMYFPMGTNLSFYDENGYQINKYGFAKTGSIKVTVDGDKITFTGDIETENGKHFTFNYTGPASAISDYTATSAPAHKDNTTEVITPAGKLNVGTQFKSKNTELFLIKK